MPISRNNHYVPQFYLEKWGSNKKIWKYALLVPNENVPMWTSSSIKHTASQDNLYVRWYDGVEIDDFEQFFGSEFENKAKQSIDKAVSGERLSMDDWHNMIDFVGAQIVRTPAFYQKMRPIIRNAMKQALEESVEKLQKIEDISVLKAANHKIQSSFDQELIPIQYVDEGESNISGFVDVRFETVEGKSTWLWAMRHLIKEPLKQLHNHKWSIITTEVPIPTSDDPVICLNYYSENDYIFDGGWMQKGTEIICPISPYKILYTQVGVRHEPRIWYTKDQSAVFKKMIVEHAFREVYAMDQDPEVCVIRPRIINQELFVTEKREVDGWYQTYIDGESTMLKSKHQIIKNEDNLE